MNPVDVNQILLRNLEQNDLSVLYEFNLDPEANQLAATIPRTADEFAAHWKNRLADPNVVAKTIFLGDRLVGCIACFQQDGLMSVGYWLGRDFWGKGIASKALELFLIEIQTRPLYACVATHNRASLRALQKCGFVVQNHQSSPADNRYRECEVALLRLI